MCWNPFEYEVMMKEGYHQLIILPYKKNKSPRGNLSNDKKEKNILLLKGLLTHFPIDHAKMMNDEGNRWSKVWNFFPLKRPYLLFFPIFSKCANAMNIMQSEKKPPQIGQDFTNKF